MGAAPLTDDIWKSCFNIVVAQEIVAHIVSKYYLFYIAGINLEN
jgi:hypothetical protein